MLRIVQFEIPGQGRRVGVVDGDDVRDLTSVRTEWQRVFDVFESAQRAERTMVDLLQMALDEPGCAVRKYADLLAAKPGGEAASLVPPIDHVEPHRLMISGTGLTHVGGMKSRNQMHGGKASETAAEAPQTDSARMFAMGIEGGKPADGHRGVAPEWFFKGNGTHLRGPNETLEIPAFALDGGEEPEIAGVYINDDDGTPHRIGFALGNEWSDHATERINYLYLAPSKLRMCALGPEIAIGHDFQDIRLRCRVSREGKTIYDSGELFTGENAMCHSLANCEDHHFKYPQHRLPGDVHVHFFGTSKLSFSARDWKYQPGDVVTIEAPGFSAPLVNTVSAGDPGLSEPVRVALA